MVSSWRPYKNWQVFLVLICVAISILLMQPQYTKDGWKVGLTTGFDISGGVRAVLKPVPLNRTVNVSLSLPPNATQAEILNLSGSQLMSNESLQEYAGGTEVTEQTLRYVVEILQQRLDFTGLRNVAVRSASGGEGEEYIIIEAAGLTSSDVEDFLSKQGNFEAKIGNETIFTGGDVLVDTYRSGLQEQTAQEGKYYRYSIAVQITNYSSMQKFADVTKNLSVNYTLTGEGQYLSEKLDLFMDGKNVDSLNIASDLKGRIINSASVEGGAPTRKEAETNMKRMETLLRTGALPIGLEVVSIDRVSPKLGSEFLNNILLAAVLTILAVTGILYLKYRNVNLLLPIMANSMCEIVLTLGIASLIKWTLDLASIAGIIISIGVGVDSEIIMIDEVKSKETPESDEKVTGRQLKTRLKKAMFIMITVFGALVVAMLPLIFGSFGAIRGFAITTIIGAAAGFMITRPAFARILDGLSVEGKV